MMMVIIIIFLLFSSSSVFFTHARLKNVARLRRVSQSFLVSSNSLIPCHVRFDIPTDFLHFLVSYLLAVYVLSPLLVFFFNF